MHRISYTTQVSRQPWGSPAQTVGTTTDRNAILSGIQDLTYDYDANNNITRIIDISNSSTSKTTTYTYDTLNRMLTASSTASATGTNYKYTYVYDAIGNITSSTPSGAYGYATTTTGYVNPHAALIIGGVNYAYDTNGNLTSDGLWTHTWDYRNRLSQSTKTGASTTYGYDHNNMRVKLVTASTTTIIPFPSYSTENGEAVKYVMAGGQLVATLRGTGTSTVAYYLHPDHLGSSDKTTSDSAEVVQVADNFPYGEVRQDTKSGGYENRKGYTSKDYDSDTGLNQFEARYYKSAVGRFISQDPIFWQLTSDILSDPQQMNSYSYGRNNPIKYLDPDGRKAELYVRYVPGTWTGMHIGYLLTPDNPNDSALKYPSGVPQGTAVFTIGGYNNNDVLQKGYGYPDQPAAERNTDYYTMASPGRYGYFYSTELVPPAGMTDTEFINKFVSEADAMTDGQEYFFGGVIPGFRTGNSNTFGYSLGDRVGVGDQVKNFTNIVPGLVPGVSRLPMPYPNSYYNQQKSPYTSQSQSYQATLDGIQAQINSIRGQINALMNKKY